MPLQPPQLRLTAPPPPLVNPNFFCYHNATLQCLASLMHRAEFRQAVDQLRNGRGVIRAFRDVLWNLARPEGRDDFARPPDSVQYIKQMLTDPELNPPGNDYFEFEGEVYDRNQFGFFEVEPHDASELLMRYISRLFSGNTAGNPFELELQKQIIRRDAHGELTIVRADDHLTDSPFGLIVRPDEDGGGGGGGGNRGHCDRDLSAVLQRQLFNSVTPNNDVIIKFISPDPDLSLIHI